jgi:hypothetical protein
MIENPPETMNKHITIQEEHIQLTRRQFLERRIDSPSLEGDIQLPWLQKANTFPSDVCPSQVPQQNSEGTRVLFAPRQYPSLNSDNFRTKRCSTRSRPSIWVALWESYQGIPGSALLCRLQQSVSTTPRPETP